MMAGRADPRSFESEADAATPITIS